MAHMLGIKVYIPILIGENSNSVLTRKVNIVEVLENNEVQPPCALF
jgi:hypothetical protein